MAAQTKKGDSKKSKENPKGKFSNFISEIINTFKGDTEVSLNMKKVIVATLSVVFFIALLMVAWIEGGRKRVLEFPDINVTSENEGCMNCHQVDTPGVVRQWKESAHAGEGVGCYNCHRAEEGEPDAFDHNGKWIATIVSPKDCATCHKTAADQFAASHHAKAGQILGSLDNVLAEVVEGHVIRDANGNKTKESAAAVSGCMQCHGSEVKLLENGKLDPATWPNTGIGRINPDGSKGACSSCHMRHKFSIAQARQPESCGKCHMGPDHPHIEIYMESKHGIAFVSDRPNMVEQMKKKQWWPGTDFEAGPTCSTCHMGATSDLEATHDVGARISWNLRPPVSEKIDTYEGREKPTWQERRKEMQSVCRKCHSDQWVGNWYIQFDDFIGLYNDKFGKPATKLYKFIREKGLITSVVTFDDKIEFTYFYLWHHEGRRARHGASMMGPDYAQWHGMYEVAERFYQEFVPELREIIEKNKRKGGTKRASALEAERMLNQILNSPMHKWFLGK